MKSFMRWVDRFCVRHPYFGLNNLMMYLIIGNAAVWLFSMMDTTGTVLYYLALNPEQILRGQIWRLATFALIPDASGIWALLFLYFYYFIGTALDREWGSAKFNMYFFSGMVFTIVYCFAVYFITGRSMQIGASYIYMSMFFSFATFYPNQRVLLFYFIPIRIKWLAFVNAAYFLVAVVTNPFPFNLLPLVATLNYLLFCGDMLFADFTPARRQQRKKTVNFRREASRIRTEQARAPYRFRCEVCGRTDVSHPQLEFRYCSRCAGYHCFCQEHINNHIHFTE